MYVKLLYTLLNALSSRCCQGIVWSSMPSWKSWTYRSKHSGYSSILNALHRWYCVMSCVCIFGSKQVTYPILWHNCWSPAARSCQPIVPPQRANTIIKYYQIWSNDRLLRLSTSRISLQRRVRSSSCSIHVHPFPPSHADLKILKPSLHRSRILRNPFEFRASWFALPCFKQPAVRHQELYMPGRFCHHVEWRSSYTSSVINIHPHGCQCQTLSNPQSMPDSWNSFGGMCCSFSLATSMQLTLGLPNFRVSRFLGAPKNANQFQEMRSLARTCSAWKEYYFLIHSAHCPWHSRPATSWELIQSVPASHWNVRAFLAPSHNRSHWTTSQHAQYCVTTCMQIQSNLYILLYIDLVQCLLAFA